MGSVSTRNNIVCPWLTYKSGQMISSIDKKNKNEWIVVDILTNNECNKQSVKSFQTKAFIKENIHLIVICLL